MTHATVTWYTRMSVLTFDVQASPWRRCHVDDNSLQQTAVVEALTSDVCIACDGRGGSVEGGTGGHLSDVVAGAVSVKPHIVGTQNLASCESVHER